MMANNLEAANAKHIEIINKELGETRDRITQIEISTAKIKTDVAWLKKTYWVVAGASVGSVIAAIFNLLA